MTAKEIINSITLMFDENRPPGQADLNIVINQRMAEKIPVKEPLLNEMDSFR